MEDIKAQIDQELQEYFQNEAKALPDSGMFADIKGKLKATELIMNKAADIAINIANPYLEFKEESEKEALVTYIKERLSKHYKDWFTK